MFSQKITIGLVMVILVLLLAGSVAAGRAAFTDDLAIPVAVTGTAFTYQGQLTDNGNLANGPYDFSFLLFDALTGGSGVGASIVVPDVMVSEGLFTAALDFQDMFDGQAIWLEIAVRPGDSNNAYTILSPRQPLTAAPYALSLRPGARVAGDVSAGEGVLNLSSSAIGSRGVVVESVSDHGLLVESSGNDGVRVESANGEGVSIISAADMGIYVGSSGEAGVYVDSTGQTGIFVNSASTSGVLVNSAGYDGFRVCSTGSEVCVDLDGDNYNGLEVGQAEDYGARVVNAGRAGFRIDNPGTNGFYATDAGDSGIWVTAATNYAGFFNGDINVTGNCTGCLLATFGLNVGNSPLRPGDIVTIAGMEQSRAANAEMVLQVQPAAAGRPLLGVVAGRADWHTSAEDGTTVLVPREGETAVPGDYLTIITHGPVQVLAGNNSGITPGTRLTLDGYGRVRPLQTVLVDGVSLAENAPVIGLALSAPDAAGLVWVLVNPQ